MSIEQSESYAGGAVRGRERALRASLKLDAAASGGLGLLLAAACVPLAGPLGLPVALLLPVGLFLLGYAGWLWYLASRPAVDRASAWVVVAGNAVWVVVSVGFAAEGWFSPTALGTGFVLAQAAAVAAFVAMQYAGLRRAGSAAG